MISSTSRKSSNRLAEPEKTRDPLMGKVVKIVSAPPAANSACTGCGICAERCPAQAIDHADPRVVNQSQCISCMRCVAVCPHDARRPNRFIVWLAGLMIRKACSKRKDPELFL